MTALLTPEEVHKITRRNHTTFLDCEIVDQSDDEVRLLLRDREAICERLVSIDHVLRGSPSRNAVGAVSHTDIGTSLRDATRAMEALLSELRGGK